MEICYLPSLSQEEAEEGKEMSELIGEGHSGECSDIFGCSDNCEAHKYKTTFSMTEMGAMISENKTLKKEIESLERQLQEAKGCDHLDKPYRDLLERNKKLEKENGALRKSLELQKKAKEALSDRGKE